jgi:ribonucleotide monophosphatase NagD (HAD superfamily)
MKKLTLSSLGHTWILDLDGTIVKHNGYKIDGEDTFLEGAEEFLKSLPSGDMIVFVTARTDEHKEITEQFLAKHNIRYEHIIFNAPFGERILVNDKKTSGLETAVALNLERDASWELSVRIDEKL